MPRKLAADELDVEDMSSDEEADRLEEVEYVVSLADIVSELELAWWPLPLGQDGVGGYSAGLPYAAVPYSLSRSRTVWTRMARRLSQAFQAAAPAAMVPVTRAVTSATRQGRGTLPASCFETPGSVVVGIVTMMVVVLVLILGTVVELVAVDPVVCVVANAGHSASATISMVAGREMQPVRTSAHPGLLA
jgi:hypothetical protein